MTPSPTPSRPALTDTGVEPTRECIDTPIIIAHQGVQGSHPANSRDAVLSALGTAHGVEFDTYALPNPSSGKTEVVVIHPEGYFFYVNRAGMKNHEQLPIGLDELRQVTVDGKPLVPTLREILDSYQARCDATGIRTRIEIELKGPDTAEAVVPVVQEYISKGVLTYDDVALCAFCYEGEERSRLQIARELDPQITLSLSVRGGDFSQDAFRSWNDVFAYAREHKIEWLDVTRRNLTSEVVKQIHDEGFKLTCHHLRTTDELQDAISLGVDSIRADMFAGATAGDYHNLLDVASNLRQLFKTSGLCRSSDWIWEIGHEARKSLVTSPRAENPHASSDAHAAVLVDTSGSILVVPCENGKQADSACNVSHFAIQQPLLSEREKAETSASMPLSDLLSDAGFVSSIQRHLEILPHLSPQQRSSAQAMLEQLSPTQIIELVESASPRAFNQITPPLDPESYSELTALISYSLIRAGRLVGMLAVTAARPLDNARGLYSVSVRTPLDSSSIFRESVVEQATAQCLRSGNSCNVEFSV